MMVRKQIGTYLFWGLLGFFVVLGVKGIAKTYASFFPPDNCHLYIMKINDKFEAHCGPNGGSCQGSYNCVLKNGPVGPGGSLGRAFWCVCENNQGETRVPRIECLEDVWIGPGGEEIEEINCGQKTCPSPCYALSNWDELENVDDVPACYCPKS